MTEKQRQQPGAACATSSTRNRRHRVSLSTTTKKRYSNLAPSLMALAAAKTEAEAAEKSIGNAEPRRSFALEMEGIPSFRQLNGDSLFDEDTSRREESSLNSSRHDNLDISQRRLRRQISHRLRNACNEGSIRIPETKVTVQRVASKDNDLFTPVGSSRSFLTEPTTSSSSLESSLQEDEIFWDANAMRNSRSCRDFGFTMDNDTNNSARGPRSHTTGRNHRSCSSIHFDPEELVQRLSSSSTRLANKYGNLTDRLRSSVSKDEEFFFVPPGSNPSDLMPMMEVTNSSTKPTAPKRLPPRRRSTSDAKDIQKGKTDKESSSSHHRRRRDPPPSATHQAPTRSKSRSNHSRRTSRRLGGSYSSLSRTPPRKQDDADARELLSKVRKSDEDDVLVTAGSSDSCKKLQEQQLQWSLPSLMARGREHRRSSHRRQQQQDVLCQQFFGEAMSPESK